MHTAYYWQWFTSLPYGVARRISGRTAKSYALIEPFVSNKTGLEIGGPSPIFGKRKLIPVYDRCVRIDNCNFASRTIWDSPANSNENAVLYEHKFVADGADVGLLGGRNYDFVLASHVLEHVANPLRALTQWRSVLHPKGMMLVIVPDKDGTFDHRRPFTSLEHIENDFANAVPESDLSHMEEILALHDLALDPHAGTPVQFRQRCRQNFTVRAMHHHVFCPDVLRKMFLQLGMQVLDISKEKPYHILVVARPDDHAIA